MPLAGQKRVAMAEETRTKVQAGLRLIAGREIENEHENEREHEHDE